MLNGLPLQTPLAQGDASSLPAEGHIHSLRPDYKCSKGVPAPPGCPRGDQNQSGVGLVVMKVPRTGSTWLVKELRSLANATSIEFEPFTDMVAERCPGHYYTAAIGLLMSSRLQARGRQAEALPALRTTADGAMRPRSASRAPTEESRAIGATTSATRVGSRAGPWEMTAAGG